MLFERLKTETAEAHLRLESALDLVREDLTLCEYQRLLVGFYGFYLPWQHTVQRQPGLHDIVQQRNKLPLLEADLRYFQIAPGSVPICNHLPPLTNSDEVLGSMYVLEGATLGGQLLTRHFHDRFGLSVGAGCSFFASYGHQVGLMWRAFREEVVARTPTNRYDALVASAAATFALLEAWIAEHPPFGAGHNAMPLAN
jgi:heme oxygenase (biliverdin-IX-beta and delta-forming)